MYDQSDCPELVGAQVTLILYIFYLIFLNILLTNLLTAIFRFELISSNLFFLYIFIIKIIEFFVSSKTYSTIQQESDSIWKYQRYSLIYEYFHKLALPPPLVVLTFVTYLMSWLARFLKKFFLKKLMPSENLFNKIFFYFYQDYTSGFSELKYLF